MEVMDLSVKNKPLVSTSSFRPYEAKMEPFYGMVNHHALQTPLVLPPTFSHHPGDFIRVPNLQPHSALSTIVPNHQRYSSETESDNISTHSSSHDESDLPDSSSRLPDINSNSLCANPYGRSVSRPFKSINPLAMSLGTFRMDKDSMAAYEEFRQKMLSQVQGATGNEINKNMRRTIQASNPQSSDPSYLEKRKKNNEAAKRSRDARRAKEDEIAIRCAFLEQENVKLKLQLATIERQKKALLEMTGRR
ncbi:uncharacterized protein LOC132705239 [Cylas formicarius]|uniref:uncharacterized protein LOC132705239 n=1 Tax=Cylas formicarius TaxID=197179 RepID=UPI002958D098|nr:uncharacterized protein LOC132705239 [Cylas formicarius]